MKHLQSTGRYWFVLIVAACLSLPVSVRAEEAATPSGNTGTKNQLLDFQVNDAPTYIQSQKLSLFSEQRLLKYTGQVKVLHDGMNMSCDELEAYYTENNEIIRLIAKFNVYITKGPEIKARSEKAVYEKATETVTLTENPELQQEKSILAADLIRIFLNEDRSEAEGDVRVKLLEPEEDKTKDNQREQVKERPTFKNL